ncbi:hypothetical protein [Mycobacterium talmoniae]|uniref:Fur family transcriptional regulator n=1 Tax=Mycobacterium talmoniae TaxID=1858794 RepID=A0A1S1NIF1_9MYCO|nr:MULTISPECIES: hypothetical protein [Mycobacterium]OHV03733.1 hypothetical protein BKN37_13490 [Mycobacterium talmoniae]PQM46629.1 hypothetical protein C1Y40_03206 [Mycobacterium talmoniae]TDH50569.1 hypothetical protein E2F47_17735 [Mycobacterium eburneum]
MRISPLQAEILAIIRGFGSPVNTTEVRHLLNEQRIRPLVAEQVYHALVTLQRHRQVRRVPRPGTRNVYWEPHPDAAPGSVNLLRKTGGTIAPDSLSAG